MKKILILAVSVIMTFGFAISLLAENIQTHSASGVSIVVPENWFFNHNGITAAKQLRLWSRNRNIWIYIEILNEDADKYNYEDFTNPGSKNFGLPGAYGTTGVNWSKGTKYRENINGMQGWRLSGGIDSKGHERIVSVVKAKSKFPVVISLTIHKDTPTSERLEAVKVLKTLKAN